MAAGLRFGALALAAVLACAAPARAQQTLADVKAELTTLDGQIQQLRAELVRSGAGAVVVDRDVGAGVVQRARDHGADAFRGTRHERPAAVECGLSYRVRGHRASTS